jgi:hypothetical protein
MANELPKEIIRRVHHNFLIPNPLMTDALPLYNSNLRPNNASFMACFERGGEMARRVWSKLKESQGGYKWGDFLTNHYDTKNDQLDKSDLYKLYNNNIRYFIYPLIVPETSIHKYNVHRDTFACCVAEAIASGVEVITFPVAALPNTYEDMLHYIPLPKGISVDDINNPYFDPKFPGLYSDEQVDVIMRMVHDLNITYESRADQRLHNAQRVISMYHPERIGKMWLEALETIGH